MAAIDEEFDPVDEARIVRSEEEDRLRDFFGLPNAPRRDQAGEIILGAGRLLAAAEQIVEASRIGHPRADRVNANMTVLEIEDPVTGEVAHGCLGGGIDAEGRR